MRLGSWQAVAHGADAVLFFQWRASRGGAEKFHSAMVPHAGPESRTFTEVRELGRELAGHAGLAGSRVRARAALVLDWPSWWALEQPSHPSTRLRQMEAALSHYTPLWRANITCDVVHPEADLTPYALVVLPNLYLLDDRAAAGLTRFTEAGGHLLTSFFTAVADENDRIHPGGPPGPLAPVLGLHTTEFWPLAKGESVQLGAAAFDVTEAHGTLWSEETRLEGAEPLVVFGSGGAEGHAAFTRHGYGAGVAYYLATRPDPAAMRKFMGYVCDEAGVGPAVGGLPENTEAVVREGGDGTRYAVILDHDTAEVTVRPA
jgi:beta-galactosidase